MLTWALSYPHRSLARLHYRQLRLQLNGQRPWDRSSPAAAAKNLSTDGWGRLTEVRFFGASAYMPRMHMHPNAY